MDKGKRKGGAEKERDRKKRRFIEEASKCQNLDLFLKPVNFTERETEANTAECVKSTRIESENILSRNDCTDNLNLDDESVVLEKNNFFERPVNYMN